MATLEQLREQKRELEEKLYAGDLSVEPALDRIDRAIAARSLKIRHSRERLAAVKQAVASGMDKDEARRPRRRAAAKKLEEQLAKRPLNKF